MANQGSDIPASLQASLEEASGESEYISPSGMIGPWLNTPSFHQERVHAHLQEKQASI